MRNKRSANAFLGIRHYRTFVGLLFGVVYNLLFYFSLCVHAA